MRGTLDPEYAFHLQMEKYRFITPNRTGKWYPDLESAKRFANRIGAGFMEARTGKFVAYAETKLEVAPAASGNDGMHVA